MKTNIKWVPRLLAITGIYSLLSLAMMLFASVSTMAGIENYWLHEHIEFFYPGIFYAFVFIALFVGSWRDASNYIKMNYKQSQESQDSND